MQPYLALLQEGRWHAKIFVILKFVKGSNHHKNSFYAALPYRLILLQETFYALNSRSLNHMTIILLIVSKNFLLKIFNI